MSSIKAISRLFTFLLLFLLVFILTACFKVDKNLPSIQAAIKYISYETDSLGPDPIHHAQEGKKFIVLDMEITNQTPNKNFPIHRMYFFLLTSSQRFMAYYNANMPDIIHPIDNNSEILPGETVRQTTLFEVPNGITDYTFEYDNNYGHFDNENIEWVEVENLES